VLSAIHLNTYKKETTLKLLRYGESGSERPGILDDEGVIRDLRGIVDDISGEALLDESLRKLEAQDIKELPVVSSNIRLGPCVAGVGKFICIGLNYSDHAKEAGQDVPTEPIMFMKATSAISGPSDPIVIPKGSQKTDWEVELGVVIGKSAKYVEINNALDHVAGYCVVNDLSERSFQLERGGQWVKGKSCDSFGSIGPWLVTRDEVKDPQDLTMWLDVDAKRYQQGNTSTMVFGVAELVSYCSQFMSLQTGDIIATGTPPGVGLGQKPDPIYLKPGQTVNLGIEGLGAQSQFTMNE
jgi:ureidoglycolate lyase